MWKFASAVWRLRHSDECQARIEHKMLEDTTGERALRLFNMVVPVRLGRRDQSLRGAGTLRSNLAETWSEQGCRILKALCVQQRRRGYSRVKSSRPLWTRSASMPWSWCVARGRIGRRGDILARAFGEVGERLQRAPRCGCGPAVLMGPGLGGSTGVLEDVACRASRVGDRITAESKAFTLDQRRTRSASAGDHTSELSLCRLSMAKKAWSTLCPRTSMESFFVGPGLLEGSKRTARCGCGAMRSALVWPGGALASEGWWLGGTSIDAADWLGDIHDRPCT